MIYTKLQQITIILHSISFHYAYKFRNSMNLSLLVYFHYILTGAKNIIFNLTILLKQNKRIGDYT
jgi:hypothetical protein